MTCVIGLVHEGHVIMGADSAGASGWTVRKTCLPKVYLHQDRFVIGYTTWARFYGGISMCPRNSRRWPIWDTW